MYFLGRREKRKENKIATSNKPSSFAVTHRIRKKRT
jgi:hypothetical protein